MTTPAKRARRRAASPLWSRYGAPLAFLLAATVAVLLIRSALHQGSPPAATTTVARTTPAANAKAKPAARPATTTAAAAPKVVVVQAGDTFGSIAAKAGATVAEIERLNPGVAPTSLHIGQKIRVP